MQSIFKIITSISQSYLSVPPFSSLIIVELHFQKLRHRQNHVNLFYCLQGVSNFILLCYCDDWKIFFLWLLSWALWICHLNETFYNFFHGIYCTTKMNFALCPWERKQTLTTTLHFGLFLWKCSAMCCGWLFFFQGGISFNPRVPYTVLATLWLDLLWLVLYIPNIPCVNKMADSHSKVEN